MTTDSNLIRKTFTPQLDQSDCGAACLLSIVKYYRGTGTIENIRRQSGTNITGTTLLGLYQAANCLGFDAEGVEAGIEAITNHGVPCILYANTNHYIIFYGTAEKSNELVFVIGDPAKGILYLNSEQLSAIWQTRKCLLLTPNENFKKTAVINRAKRKWVIGLIKTEFPLLSIAAGLGIAIAALSLSMAIFSQRLIDQILPKKEFSKLYLGIALVFLLLIVKEGLSVLRQYFLLRQGKDFNSRIIDFFYRHLLQLPKVFFDTRKIGEFTARLSDTGRIQKVISQLAGNTTIDMLTAIVSTVFVFTYSWQVGVGCLFAMPCFYLLIYFHNKKIIEGQRSIMVSYAVTEANYISTLQGIESIKNYNKQDLFSTANKNIYERFQSNIFSLGKIQIRLSFLANTFGIIFLIAVLTYTSYQVLHGQLKTGELIAIISMCGSLLPSIANLALISIPISEAKIAFDRMFEFTSVEAEPTNHRSGSRDLNSLHVQNVSFRFAGRSPIIKNISFTVSKGEVIAIMGENGCGKSTLVQILQKHYRPESGTITLNTELLLDDISTTDWRKLIGVVPQSIHIFNGTVLENIAFDDAANKTQEVMSFLQEFGFASFIDSLPQSLMTLVGEEGINLSGGQKQMIALARALYHKPQLLILDEATAAMDRTSELFVLQLLQQLKKEMAVIFITHRLHVLKSFCDRIYILENGTIMNFGNHNQLLKSKNLYSSYWSDLAN